MIGSHSSDRDVVLCHLGRIEYGLCWDLQRQIQNRLIEARRQEAGPLPPNVVLFVEHPPVFTLGKSGNEHNLLLSPGELERRGASFFHVDRGGDITFHGPGQLVGYPILDLERFFRDIHRYLRELEEMIIQTCEDYGIEGRRFEGRTGVWIGPDARGLERKICAMGVRSSRWVTMHGFAFNLNTDLDYFSFIIPCGITDRSVTSLRKELGSEVDESVVRERVAYHFGKRFEAPIRVLERPEAIAFLHEYLEDDSIVLEKDRTAASGV